jgi:hypothetical protein
MILRNFKEAAWSREKKEKKKRKEKKRRRHIHKLPGLIG